jgi:CheY-like chemotaxis protein
MKWMEDGIMDGSDAILLVEDDEVDVAAVRRAFSRREIANPLFVVRNGEEALSFLHRTGADTGEDTPIPALVLLDLSLPRLSGLELLERIREDAILRNLPVVVLTTSRHAIDRQRSFALWAAGYFVKPADFAELETLVDNIHRYWSGSESME